MSDIVLVTGSRKWVDEQSIFKALDELNPRAVVHGGAMGADSIAHKWAKERGRGSFVYFPDYESEGKGAPLIRNTAMVNMYHESATMLACPFPDSRGTRFTMRVGKDKGMTIKVLEYPG